jgi:hypothetical protein
MSSCIVMLAGSIPWRRAGIKTIFTDTNDFRIFLELRHRFRVFPEISEAAPRTKMPPPMVCHSGGLIPMARVAMWPLR